LTRAIFVNNIIYLAFLLNSQAPGASGKNEHLPKHHGARPQRCGAQCSCIGCIGLKPALVAVDQGSHSVGSICVPNRITPVA